MRCRLPTTSQSFLPSAPPAPASPPLLSTPTSSTSSRGAPLPPALSLILHQPPLQDRTRRHGARLPSLCPSPRRRRRRHCQRDKRRAEYELAQPCLSFVCPPHLTSAAAAACSSGLKVLNEDIVMPVVEAVKADLVKGGKCPSSEFVPERERERLRSDAAGKANAALSEHCASVPKAASDIISGRRPPTPALPSLLLLFI